MTLQRRVPIRRDRPLRRIVLLLLLLLPLLVGTIKPLLLLLLLLIHPTIASPQPDAHPAASIIILQPQSIDTQRRRELVDIRRNVRARAGGHQGGVVAAVVAVVGG